MGQTNGSPFMNAYSARSIREVIVAHYSPCDITSVPLVLGDTSMASFNPVLIPSHNVEFTSTSATIGVTDAELIVKFKPETTFKAKGRISVEVPPWFIISEQQQPTLESSESMLSAESVGYFRDDP